MNRLVINCTKRPCLQTSGREHNSESEQDKMWLHTLRNPECNLPSVSLSKTWRRKTNIIIRLQLGLQRDSRVILKA